MFRLPSQLITFVITVLLSNRTVQGQGYSTTLYATESNQYIESPNYPLAYSSNTNYTWHITTQLNRYIIFVNITFFSLETEANCNYDYLALYDGIYNSPIAKLCGSYLSRTTYQSTGSDMTIVFHSDSSNNYAGFYLNYRAVSKSVLNSVLCGTGSLLASTATDFIQSPNYPFNYPNNTDCTWVISTSSSAYVIYATITSYSLENSNNCGFDYLAIYDGTTQQSNQLAKLCGFSQSTRSYQSTGSMMTITFHSDSTNSYSGFQLNYRAILKSTTSVAQCGNGPLTATSVQNYIESPNYPLNYPNNMDCTWHINTYSDSYIVAVSITSFDLENSANCNFDYLGIYNGATAYSNPLTKLCGSYLTTTSYQSTGSAMTIVFHSDSSNNSSGFYLNYRTVLKPSSSVAPCNSGPLTATSYSNYIQSPNYPFNYQNNADCTWHITTDFPNKIYISITSFTLESSNDCGFDYLQLLDGSSTYSSQITKLCGSHYSTMNYQSTGSSMTIVFHSDSSNAYSGFYLSYSTTPYVEYSVGSTYTRDSGLSNGAIAGIIIGCLVVLVVAITLLVVRSKRASTRSAAQTTTATRSAAQTTSPTRSAALTTTPTTRNQNGLNSARQTGVSTTGASRVPYTVMGNPQAGYANPMHAYQNTVAPNTTHSYIIPVIRNNTAPPAYTPSVAPPAYTVAVPGAEKQPGQFGPASPLNNSSAGGPSMRP